MKKIGLAVVTYKDNFGSALQTYATQKVIQSLGFETSVFDITGVQRSIRFRKIKYYLSRILHRDERHYVFDNMSSSSKRKKASDEYSKNMSIRHSMYKEFYSSNISFFPFASNWSELTKQAYECEAVVVGSDQLWGSANIAAGYFTLEFVPDNDKKIAYSTSFGVSVIPKQLHKHTKKFLNRIDFLSIREQTGKKIIQDLTGRDAPVVCDPTMLLTSEQWLEIQKKEPFTDGDYILTYFMGDNPQQREFVKRIKEKTGYKIVGLLHGSTFIESDENYCDETPYNVGPGEFLNLIRNAKYVCTDSFHCSVFSILYGTEFFSFPRDNEKSSFSTNDRLHTLLSWTGLQDRMLNGNENIDVVLTMRLDCKAINEALDNNRKQSMDYLMNALKGRC